MNAINLLDRLALLTEHWSPRVVAELNDYQGGDEMEIGFRDRTVTLRKGELFVVPRGMEHITRAARECSALVIEPRGVVNTGDAGGQLTAKNDQWV